MIPHQADVSLRVSEVRETDAPLTFQRRHFTGVLP